MNNISYVSFANTKYDLGCVRSQTKFLESLHNLFKDFKIYNEYDLKDDFNDILKYKNDYGFCYWAWKSYILYNKIMKLNNNDFIMYCDCGCKFPNEIDEFEKDINDLCNKMIQEDKNIALTNCRVKNLCICNKYLLHKMNLYHDNIFLKEYLHHQATIIIVRKTDEILSLLKQWWSFTKDNYMECIHLNYNNKNDGLPGYIHNGSDQAILQCLLYKNKMNILDINYLFCFKYKNFINHGNHY